MVQSIDKLFVLIALIYAIIGMLLGNVMGATMDHSQLPTHAHIMLVGWVSMALSGIIYRLWPQMKSGVLPLVNFGLHQIGSVVMSIALYMLYGGMVEEAAIGPVLGIAGILVMAALIVLTFIFLTKGKDA